MDVAHFVREDGFPFGFTEMLGHPFRQHQIRACKDPTNSSASGAHSSPGRLATDCSELLNLVGNAITRLLTVISISMRNRLQ
jgi:hypothetical protein